MSIGDPNKSHFVGSWGLQSGSATYLPNSKTNLVIALHALSQYPWSSLACICPSCKLLCLMKCQSLVVVHEGQQPNLFDNWADASLRLPLAVMLPLSVIAKYDSWEVLTDTTATLKVAIYKIGRWTPPLPPHKLAIILSFRLSLRPNKSCLTFLKFGVLNKWPK